jgi:hypothetical protein
MAQPNPAKWHQRNQHRHDQQMKNWRKVVQVSRHCDVLSKEAFQVDYRTEGNNPLSECHAEDSWRGIKGIR